MLINVTHSKRVQLGLLQMGFNTIQKQRLLRSTWQSHLRFMPLTFLFIWTLGSLTPINGDNVFSLNSHLFQLYSLIRY
jgi:hypothetical protein